VVDDAASTVNYVVDDVASTGNYVVDDVASTGNYVVDDVASVVYSTLHHGGLGALLLNVVGRCRLTLSNPC